jgi:hypothetical protein
LKVGFGGRLNVAFVLLSVKFSDSHHQKSKPALLLQSKNFVCAAF